MHRHKVHRIQRSEKSGLTWGGIPSVGPAANPKGPALRLRELLGETGQGLGSTLSATQYCTGDNGQQRPQRIGLHTHSILWHLLEMFDERTNLAHPLGATWGDFVFHDRQGRLEVLGLQAATSIFTKFLYEQP